jgi:hypothetical protein
MAITYSNGNVATGTTSVVITKPTGTVATDVLVALIGTDGTAVTPPAGWVSRASGATPTGAQHTEILTRVVDGGANDGATYTFSLTGSANAVGAIDGYIGVDNTTPMDATATVATGTAATVTWPNITTVTNGALHLALDGDENSGQIGTPSGYSPRSSQLGALVNVKNTDAAITTAGLVTGITGTGGLSWVAISAALRPAGGAVPDSISPANITSSAGRFIGWTV